MLLLVVLLFQTFQKLNISNLIVSTLERCFEQFYFIEFEIQDLK